VVVALIAALLLILKWNYGKENQEITEPEPTMDLKYAETNF